MSDDMPTRLPPPILDGTRVSPYVGLVLLKLLGTRREVLDDLDALAVRGDAAGMVLATLQGFEQEGRRWRDQVEAGPSTSATGNGEASEAEAVASSPPNALVSASEAAKMLGVTRERVTQMARGDALPGHKLAGRWMFDRDAVQAARAARGGDAA